MSKKLKNFMLSHIKMLGIKKNDCVLVYSDLSKFGFNNINRKEYQGVNLDTIQTLVDNKRVKSSLDFDAMIKLRLARKNELVKILGRGELKAKLKISAHKFTASAKAAIEAAGGEAINI